MAELIDGIYTKSKDREFLDSLRRFRLMDRDDGIMAQEFEKIGMQKGLLEGEKIGMLKGEKRGMLKGEKRGMQKGLLEGEETAKREIAKALLASGLAQDFVAQSTGLSPQDIAKLAEKVESSST